MPEGDTIFRAARSLDRALAGRTVLRFDTVFSRLTRASLEGRTIERVTARGKHLLMWFSGGLVLRTHMRMHGSWHLYRAGERWRRPRHLMRLALLTDAFEAVAFDVPVAELFDTSRMDTGGAVADLGPDLLSDGFDATEAIARLRARDDLEIGEALLDQTALAGIGNIFKSEALFAAGVSPFARVESLSEEALGRIVTSARALLRASTTEQGRRPPMRVYGRGGKPCRRCGTFIERRLQGANARSTYWCPRCQSG